MRKIVSLIVILFIFTTGCGGPELFLSPIVDPIVSGVLMWKDGEAQKYYEYPADHLYKSTKLALQTLQIPIVRDDNQVKNAFYIVAGDNNRFKINIVQIEKNISRISVRINIMGDKPFCELLYAKIDQTVNSLEFDGNGNRKTIKRRRWFR